MKRPPLNMCAFSVSSCRVIVVRPFPLKLCRVAAGQISEKLGVLRDVERDPGGIQNRAKATNFAEKIVAVPCAAEHSERGLALRRRLLRLLLDARLLGDLSAKARIERRERGRADWAPTVPVGGAGPGEGRFASDHEGSRREASQKT